MVLLFFNKVVRFILAAMLEGILLPSNMVVNYSLEYLDHNWDKQDRTVIVYVFPITLLEKGCDPHRFPVFWD